MEMARLEVSVAERDRIGIKAARRKEEQKASSDRRVAKGEIAGRWEQLDSRRPSKHLLPPFLFPFLFF